MTLPFLSTLPKDLQQKDLRKTPKQLLAKANWHKNRERKKRIREARSKKFRAWEKQIEGRWFYLRKLYRWRLKKAEQYLAEQKLNVSLKIPRWARQNNEFLLSLEDWLAAWNLLEKTYGLSLKDRGLGRNDEGKGVGRFPSKNRKNFNSLKFGRIDVKQPFQKGNIMFYFPIRKDEVHFWMTEGFSTACGLFEMHAEDSAFPYIKQGRDTRIVLLKA